MDVGSEDGQMAGGDEIAKSPHRHLAVCEVLRGVALLGWSFQSPRGILCLVLPLIGIAETQRPRDGVARLEHPKRNPQ